MRELDSLLIAYLDQRFDRADNEEKAAFEALLALPDPDLVAYLLQKKQPESSPIADLVRLLLSLDPA